jgi:hypothetical protein
MERGRGGPARAGISYGIAGAALGFCSFAAMTLARLLNVEFLAAFGCVAAVGTLGVLFWVGVVPARTSGRAASGAGPGAVAGACTGAGVLLGLLVDGTQNGTIPPPSGTVSALGYALGVLILLAGAAAFFACLGAGLGALGGLVGRGEFARRYPSPSAYPAYPSPSGYPPYPPYPTAGAPPYVPGWPPSAGDGPSPTYPGYSPPPYPASPADPRR